MPNIKTTNITYYYLDRKHKVATAGLFDVNLEIPSHSFTLLTGPSGSGKTTLLKVIAGLYPPEAGAIYFNEIDVTSTSPAHRNVGFVSQEFALYRHLTVFDKIAYPLKVARVPIEERRERVKAIAELLGLELTLSRRPRVLSGGEKQRVALARALIRKPDLLLLDEPLSNLEAPLRSELLALLSSLHQKLGMTLIISSHAYEETKPYATYIVKMENGTIESKGPTAQ